MSRDELSAQALAELEALDRILAREPVAEDHLELAALVDSVRGSAPAMRPQFAAELATRFEGRRRRARGRSSQRSGRFAFAGGGVVTAAVALTILLSGSVRDGLFGSGRAPTPTPLHAVSRPLVRSNPALAGPAAHGPAAGGVGTLYTGIKPTPAASSPSRVSAAVDKRGRLVTRGSTLTLASPPPQMQHVADEIVAATERQGGVVEHSSVGVQGPGSYASFSLSVPSGHLSRLIATLSSLASVRSLHQSTQDITNPYQRENTLLSRRIAELASLRKQLTLAATAADAASLRKQISSIAHRITIERATLKRLSGEAANATLSVQVVAGAAPKKHAHAAGPLTRAYHDALHALQEILAIALIVLAILLPFALCGLALWWAAWSVRQRARERAIRAA